MPTRNSPIRESWSAWRLGVFSRRPEMDSATGKVLGSQVIAVYAVDVPAYYPSLRPSGPVRYEVARSHRVRLRKQVVQAAEDGRRQISRRDGRWPRRVCHH